MLRHKYGERNRGAKGRQSRGMKVLRRGKEGGREGGSQASVRLPISSMVLCMCPWGTDATRHTDSAGFPPGQLRFAENLKLCRMGLGHNVGKGGSRRSLAPEMYMAIHPTLRLNSLSLQRELRGQMVLGGTWSVVCQGSHLIN